MAFIRNRLSFLVMFSCLSLLGAIGWQGFYGHRNIEFQKRLAAKAANAQTELDAVSDKRSALETRVSMLRPGTVDDDLVDEIARRDLNMGGKLDVIAQLPN